MLHGTGHLVTCERKQFKGNDGGTVAYAKVAVKVGDRILNGTGPEDIVAGLNGSRAKFEAGAPVAVTFVAELRGEQVTQQGKDYEVERYKLRFETLAEAKS